MKAVIETISPLGYKVCFEVGRPSPPAPLPEGEGGELEALLKLLADVETALRDAGYEATGELPRTPDGLPICRKHGAVMDKRERQGDVWFSHKVILGEGREAWCKGRPGADSPGWAY